MKNNFIIPGLLFLIVAIFSIVMINQNENSSINLNPSIEISESEGIILFYGDGCPHCVIVEEYLDENKISEQVSYVMKEVYYNKNNSNELGEKAIACGMSTKSIGVPFLWDGSKCYIGDKEIIGFFKQEINQQ